MENKKPALKIAMTIVFGILILGSFFFMRFFEFPIEWGMTPLYIYFGCICACFLFSLIFIRGDAKKILITLALLCHVAAEFFMTVAPFLAFESLSLETTRIVGVSLFCGAQFFYMLYTMILFNGIGAKIVNLAIRAVLCLLVYFILPRYIVLNTLEMIGIMYLVNSLVSLLFIICKIKQEGFMFFAFLLLFVSDLCAGLIFGSALLGWTGVFFDFIAKYDISTWIYIPSLFLIAAASVWTKKREE